MQMMPTVSCAQRVVEDATVSDLSAAAEEAVINPALGEFFSKVSFLWTNPVRRFHMLVIGFLCLGGESPQQMANARGRTDAQSG
jgi:hypothetical protein